MKAVSIAKREVRDKEFCFRQTFTTYPWNPPSFWYQWQGIFFSTQCVPKSELLQDAYEFFNKLPFTFSSLSSWEPKSSQLSHGLQNSRCASPRPWGWSSESWQVPWQFISPSHSGWLGSALPSSESIINHSNHMWWNVAGTSGQPRRYPH